MRVGPLNNITSQSQWKLPDGAVAGIPLCTNRAIFPMLLKENGSVRRPLRSQNEFLIDGIEFLNKFFDPQASPEESTLCYRIRTLLRY